MTGKLIVAPSRKATGVFSKIAKAAFIAGTTIAISATAVAPAQAFLEPKAAEYKAHVIECFFLMLTDTEEQIAQCNPKLHPKSSGSIQSLNVSSPVVTQPTPKPEDPVIEDPKEEEECEGYHCHCGDWDWEDIDWGEHDWFEVKQQDVN